MNSILFDFGFIKIHWYSVILLIAIAIGYSIVTYEGKKYKIPKEFVENLFFWTVIFGILGARLYYVIFNFQYYSSNLLSIFKIWEGGLAIHGGIIAGLIFIIMYTKKYNVQLFRMLDIIVIGLIISQAIGRWGNFFNSEAHGPVTTYVFLKKIFVPEFVIRGMYIDGVYYHPTFLYESCWCFIGFILLLLFRSRKYAKIGQTAGLYLCWYGLGRFFIELLRTDSLMLGNIKIACVVSIIMVIIGIIIIIKKAKGSVLDNRYNDVENANEIRF